MWLLYAFLSLIVTAPGTADIPNGYASEPVVLRDPNDMLSPGYDMNDQQSLAASASRNADICASNINAVNKELAACYKRVKHLEDQLKSSRTKALDKCLQTGETDFKAYYTRVIKHISRLFNFDAHSGEIGSVDKVRLEVTVSSDLWKDLSGPNPDGNTLIKLDTFFSSNWRQIPVIEQPTFFESIFSVHINPLQISVYVLGTLFIFLCSWILLLMIKDILYSRKVYKMIVVVFLIVFLGSFVWQWRLMIKKLEAERMASTMVYDREDLAKQCMGNVELSLLQKVQLKLDSWSRTLTGGVDPCKQYFNSVAIDPEDEITPLMVLSETCVSFIVQPLQSIGTHLGLFFTQLSLNTPILFLPFATAFVLIVVLAIILVASGYNFQFPLWLGGATTTKSPQEQKSKENVGEKFVNLEEYRKELQFILEKAKLDLHSICEVAVEKVHQDHTTSAQVMFSPLSKLMYQELETAVQNRLVQNISRVSLQQRRISTPSHSRRGSYKWVDESKDKVDGKLPDSDPFMNEVKEILDVT